MICVFPVFLGYIYVLYVYRRTLITQAQNTTHTKYRAVCLVSSCTVQPAASTASRYDPCITRDRRTVMHGPWLPKASSYGPCLLSAFCFVLLLLLLLVVVFALLLLVLAPCPCSLSALSAFCFLLSALWFDLGLDLDLAWSCLILPSLDLDLDLDLDLRRWAYNHAKAKGCNSEQKRESPSKSVWVQYKHQARGRSSVARSTKQKAVISALCFLFLCAALSWLRCRPSSPRHYVSLFLSIFFPRRSLLRRPSSAASSLLCFLHLYRTGSTISFMLYYRTSSKKYSSSCEVHCAVAAQFMVQAACTLFVFVCLSTRVL